MKTKKKKKSGSGKVTKILIAVCLAAALIFCGIKLWKGIIMPYLNWNDQDWVVDHMAEIEIPDWIDSQIIDIDGVSRKGTRLSAVNGIVVHYVGNPGSTAQQNHDYYASSASDVSSHFIIGLEGEIIQCLPLNERSVASNDRNPDTISIEVCHPDSTGAFNQATYDSLVKLTAWLCTEAHLTTDDVIRHYDVTGKECPRYYVQHPEAWESFRQDVNWAMSQEK